MFLATDEVLNGLEDNVQDYCKRVRDVRIGGRIFHGLPKHKQAELLLSIEIPVKHRRLIISRMAEVAEKQDIIHFPGRKEMEAFEHSLPIGIGKVSKFKIIGYVGINEDTSIYKVWKTICNDVKMSEELLKVKPEVKEWWVCRLDDEPVSLLSSTVEKATEKYSKRDRRRNRSRARSRSPSKGGNRRKSSREGTYGDGEKEEGVPGKDGLTSLAREQLSKCISPQFPAWDNLAPMFLLQPKHLHIYTGVKWGGVSEVRYWSTQHDLQRKEQSWKQAHQLHIQGYEDKKRWAQELVEENHAVLARAKTREAHRKNAKRMKDKGY